MTLFSKKSFAVDIGSRSIKGLRLKKVKGQLAVDKFFFQDLASNNELYPLEAHTAEILKSMVDMYGLRKSPTTSFLQEQKVLTHDLVLPPMPADEMRTALYNDLEAHLNLTREETYLDFVVVEKLKENPESDGKTIEKQVVKAYCAKRESVHELIQLLAGAGLDPKHIESGILARAAMLAYNGYLEENSCYVQIDIGESHVAVSFLRGNKVLLSNILPTGLGAINRMMFETEAMPYEESEKIKLKYDFTSDDSGGSAQSPLLDEIFHEMFYKIQRMIDFFRMQMKENSISKILLTGGGCRLPHLDKALEAFCKLPIEIVNPLRKIEIYHGSNVKDDTLAHLAPHLATAVGLALRGHQ